MINVALIGLGRIGQMHAENLNKNKEIKLLQKKDPEINSIKELRNNELEVNPITKFH